MSWSSGMARTALNVIWGGSYIRTANFGNKPIYILGNVNFGYQPIRLIWQPKLEFLKCPKNLAINISAHDIVAPWLSGKHHS